MLRKAKDLGRYTSDDIKRISELKNSVLKKILEAFNKLDAIEQTAVKVQSAKGNLQRALDAYNVALHSKNSAGIALAQAQLDKQGADALELFETCEYSASLMD